VKPLRVGVVGCGEIAQIMHLPYLADLPHFEIGAICDLSPKVVNAMGDRYGVARRYTDATDLIAQPDLDIVCVLTMDHYGIALAAIDAGKHVFVEKPLCFSVAEAQEVADRANAAGVQLMVGYMKVYDPAFEYAALYMQAMTDVRSIHVQDLTGVFDTHHPLYTLVRPDDLPPATTSQRGRIQESILATLGPGASAHADLFRKLLMLGTHDFAALRTAFGVPEAVLFSDLTPDWGITAVLDYGTGRRCLFEVGSWPKYPWFHERMIAYGRDEIVTVSFSPPFTKNTPTIVQIERSEAGRHVRNVTEVSHEEPFRREWMHFADCIADGRPPRTGGPGAVRDIELALAIIGALPAAEAAGALAARDAR
jgi:predicted dehydrogenase